MSKLLRGINTHQPSPTNAKHGNEVRVQSCPMPQLLVLSHSPTFNLQRPIRWVVFVLSVLAISKKIL